MARAPAGQNGARELKAKCGHGTRTIVIRGAPSDLVRQMRVLVAEHAFLWEVTQQVTDYYGGDKTVVNGPWQAADCQRILLRWFDRELVDCIADAWATTVGSGDMVCYEHNASWRSRATEVGQYLILDREDARTFLSDPTTWDRDGAAAAVMLCQSDKAEDLSFDDWFAALAGLPENMIREE